MKLKLLFPQFLLLGSLLCLNVSALAATQPAPHKVDPKAEGVRLAGQVVEIFKAKCADCHGSQLAKPKGRFGYVLDLKRMALNPELVVPGKPAESELYRLIETDEMPGEDADVGAMSPEEKATVRQWIAIGAPVGNVVVAEAPATVTPKNLSVIDRAFRFAGKFHSASTHMPIGMLLAAVLAELLALLFRTEKGWMVTVRFLVIMGALSACATATLGWFNGEHSSYGVGKDAWVFWWHRGLGIAVAVWSLACAWRVFSHPCEVGTPERLQLRGALWLGGALVTAAGSLGGALVYGLNHYSW
jgi:uncharacterized membrane protein